MTTYLDGQVISSAEANKIVKTHGYVLATMNGSAVTLEDNTDNGEFFTEDDVITIMATDNGVQLRVKEDRFTVHLSKTVKANCGDVWVNNWTCDQNPEWTIEV